MASECPYWEQNIQHIVAFAHVAFRTKLKKKICSPHRRGFFPESRSNGNMTSLYTCNQHLRWFLMACKRTITKIYKATLAVYWPRQSEPCWSGYIFFNEQSWSKKRYTTLPPATRHTGPNSLQKNSGRGERHWEKQRSLGVCEEPPVFGYRGVTGSAARSRPGANPCISTRYLAGVVGN